MEVIQLSGYTTEEKVQIARRHLLPKLIEQHGLGRRKIRFSDAALRRVIADYTQEAGLRNLERELATIFRKVAVAVARGEEGPRSMTRESVAELLGPARHFSEELLSSDRVGVATGLAWTAAGGDLLFIEVVAVPGQRPSPPDRPARRRHARVGPGGAELRPSLLCRQQSARGLLLHSRSSHPCSGRLYSQGRPIGRDHHRHRDRLGASGIGPCRRRVAMTGEITLRGDVLPIGGVKEKILAARTAGVKAVVAPRLNDRDLQQIPEDLRKGLTFHLVDHMSEVLELALKAPATVSSGRRAGRR